MYNQVMLKDFFRNYIFPIAMLSGSIIGVGFLALPYVALQVGIFTMLFYFIVITALVVIIHVIFGEISLKTPDYKRWPGFVGFYLGKIPKTIVLILNIFGLFGVLLVYLIVGSQFLTAMLSPFFGGDSLIYTLIYFTCVSAFIFLGVKAIAKFDFLAISLLLIVLLVIFLKSYTQINLDNIFSTGQNLNWKNFFLPYGAIMFSLWGLGLIPEVEEMLIGNKKSLKKIIVCSILLAATFYLLFIFLILGISGQKTTEASLIGLKDFLSQDLMTAALFIGVTTTFIAFIALGLLLKKIFMYDMGIKKFHAFLLVCFVPLTLFFMGFNAFMPIISFIGGVLLSIDGILVLLVYRKIGGKKIIVYPLTLIFVLAIIYEIIYFTN